MMSASMGRGMSPSSAQGVTGGLPNGTASAHTKSFGPPTLQSDTVVFQATKVRSSSSRNVLAAGSSAGGRPQALNRGGVVSSSPYPTYRAESDGKSPREPRGYDGRRGHHMDGTPPLPPHLLPPEHARHLPRSVSSESGRFREMLATSTTTSSAAPASYGTSMHHRSNSTSSVSSAPASLPSKAVDGMEDNDQLVEEDNSFEPSFGELLDNEVDASEAMMAPQRPPSRSASQLMSNGQERTIRLTIRVMKEGDKLGFGIRNDPDHKLCVSTLQSNSSAANSSMRIGDTILSVNGVDLTNLGFLEVIQQLKATKPGELVFEIERTIVEPHATASTPAMMQQVNADSPLVTTPTGASSHPVLPRQPTPALAPPAEQRSSQLSMAPQATIMGAIPSARRMTPPALQSAMHSEMMPEQPRKRARTAGMLSQSQLEVELTRHEKQHRAVVNALTLELKKEKTEKQSLEEKNGALRKRLQKMLIECDDVRVKANRAVTSIKDQSRRDIEELKVALQTARAQLRLQDRGPDVTRTDSIIGDLNAAKLQLDRFKKAELERKAVLAARYSFESRVAERDAHRIRDQLISRTCAQLRDVARRFYGGGSNANMGARKSGADNDSVLNVHFEGVRRLTLMKLFGLPVTFEWYSSEEYYSATLVRQTLARQEDVLDVFGNALCHEERVGFFLVASAPMEIVYDPTIERVTLTCSWSEQNQIRELARSFRF